MDRLRYLWSPEISNLPFILYHYSVCSLVTVQYIPPKHQWTYIVPGRQIAASEAHWTRMFSFTHCKHIGIMSQSQQTPYSSLFHLNITLNLHYLGLNLSFTNNKLCKWWSLLSKALSVALDKIRTNPEADVKSYVLH